MAETLTKAEYLHGLTTAHVVAGMVRALPLDAMREVIGLTHAVAPITDPTLYRDNLEKLRQDEAVLNVLHTAQLAIKKLYAPAEVIGG